MAYRAKQEQDDGSQTTNTTGNGTPKDTAGSSYRRILSLLSDVTGGIESDQDTSGSQVRQTPVPTFRCTGSVVGCHESLMGGTEAPGLGCSDGQPDEVQEEVQHDEAS